MNPSISAPVADCRFVSCSTVTTYPLRAFVATVRSCPRVFGAPFWSVSNGRVLLVVFVAVGFALPFTIAPVVVPFTVKVSEVLTFAVTRTLSTIATRVLPISSGPAVTVNSYDWMPDGFTSRTVPPSALLPILMVTVAEVAIDSLAPARSVIVSPDQVNPHSVAPGAPATRVSSMPSISRSTSPTVTELVPVNWDGNVTVMDSLLFTFEGVTN